MIAALDADGLAQLHDLRLELHRHHAALGEPTGWTTRDEGAVWTGWVEGVRAVVEAGRGVVFGARDGDDRLVGFAYVIEVPPEALERAVLRGTGPHVELVTLVVAHGSRGGGTGEALMDAARAWARERGAVAMRIDVRAANEGALRFYTRQGATPAFTSLYLEP